MSHKKITVAVVYGGRSGEHEVSLRSAAAVMKALDPEKFTVLPLRIEKLYNEFDPAAPFAVASLLALLALLTLAIKTFLVWKTERRERKAQRGG